MEDSIKIFDILKNQYWKDRVISSIPEIVMSGHKNAKSYVDLEHRLPSYDCFTVVVNTDSDKLLAISGLYNANIFPKNTARILDRTYYYDWNSQDASVSTFNSSLQFNTKLSIPFQINVARELGYDSVFISMQNKHRHVLQLMTERQIKYKFQLLSGVYNTCRALKTGELNDSNLCWQCISIHYLTENHQFLLPVKDGK